MLYWVLMIALCHELVPPRAFPLGEVPVCFSIPDCMLEPLPLPNRLLPAKLPQIPLPVLSIPRALSHLTAALALNFPPRLAGLVCVLARVTSVWWSTLSMSGGGARHDPWSSHHNPRQGLPPHPCLDCHPVMISANFVSAILFDVEQSGGVCLQQRRHQFVSW